MPPLRHDGRRDPDTRCRATGRYAADLPFFGGLRIWEANPEIVEKLREARRAAARGEVHAQLPALLAPQDADHLPRHDAVVHRHGRRARLSRDASRPSRCAQTALRGIDNTRFYPAWGKARLHGMIANRPDWTLSRQRNWGVPLPFFLHRETDELHPDTLALLELAAAKVEQGGIEPGSQSTHEDFGVDAAALPQDHRHARRLVRLRLDPPDRAGRTCRRQDRAGSHAKDTGFPADLYLEGSDQHRGWFHSSLLDRRAC